MQTKNIGFVLGRFPKLAGEKRGKKVREKVMHVGKYTYVCVVHASHLSDSIKGKQKVFSSIKKLGPGTYAHFPELAAITTHSLLLLRTKGSCSESERVFFFSHPWKHSFPFQIFVASAHSGDN